jgi:nucleoside-diphosphate-sugar epimerase
MNRVMVTGATGFLGRHVIEALKVRQLEVHAVARGFPDSPEFMGAGVHRHLVDLLDTRSVSSLLSDVRPHGLIHLAWTTTPGVYWTDPDNERWMAASRTLVESFSSQGGRRIVVAGTSAEYQWPSQTPLDEETSPVQPESLYGRSKDSLRRHLEAWAPRAGVSWAWARLFNIYGRFEHPRRLIPQSILSLLAGRPIPFDDGLAVRDFLHVADAADAFASLYQHTYCGVVNVASGEGTSIRDLLTILSHELNRTDLVQFGTKATRHGEPPYLVGASFVLRNAVGWRPRIALREGLIQTCNWWSREAADKALYPG